MIDQNQVELIIAGFMVGCVVTFIIMNMIDRYHERHKNDEKKEELQ